MESFRQDIRFAARALRKNPGFTLVAVLMLALGIGANTAIFSVVNAVVFRPLPYSEPDRLALLWNRTASGTRRIPIGAPDVADYRDRATLFEGFAFMDRGRDAALTGAGDPEHIVLGRVTANFFAVLGVDAAIGRAFLPGDGANPPSVPADSTSPVPPGAIVLSDGLWRRRFGGDPGLVGRAIEISGRSAMVVGILPGSFRLLMPPDAGMAQHVDVWWPLPEDLGQLQRRDRMRDRDSDNTGLVIGRLRPGVSLAQARAEMDAIAARQREQSAFHQQAGIYVDVETMYDEVVGHARPVLLALFGAVGFVLLIACINVANLLLARAVERRQEMALRAALGAGRLRLFRQTLTESSLLAAVGGVTGLVLTQWGSSLLFRLQPPNLPRMEHAGIDATVLGFTLAATLLAALLFGAAPALNASVHGGGELLRQHGADAHRRRRLRNALVVSEVALSLALLVGAGLMWKSFDRLQQVSPGFRPNGVLAFDLTLRHPGWYRGPADRTRFVTALEERIAALPGVQARGLVGRLPLGGRKWTQPYGFADQVPEEWNRNEANFRVITAGYFEAIGTRLLGGRFFTADDDRQDRRVVIVDETMARRIEPTGDAVGKRIGFPLDGDAVWAEVVGVVENVRHDDLRESSRETLYVPYRHEASRDISMVVRGPGDPIGLAGPIRRAVRDLAPHQPIYNVRSLTAYVADSLAATRYALRLIAAFAALALLLASVGLSGVVSYSVRQRTHEIGIRMALGEGQGSVVKHVVLHGMALAAAGVVMGTAVAMIASRALDTLLYEVHRADPATYLGVAALLGGVSLLACYFPARRAAAVDPMQSLRVEA